MNVDEYQKRLTTILYEEACADLPAMLSKLEEQSIFAYGFVSYDGPWIQAISTCSREGLTQHKRRCGEKGISFKDGEAEVCCAEWHYVGGDLSRSLKLSYELQDKFYDRAVGGIDENVPWEQAEKRFGELFFEAGVNVLSRLRAEGQLSATEFESDLFLGIHNPDPGRKAVQRMIRSSEILNGSDWHSRFLAWLPNPDDIPFE